MDFMFHMPVKVISGIGCVVKNSSLLRELGKRCLVMTGGQSSWKCGAANDVLTALKNEGIQATVFSDIAANPLLSQCQQAANAAEIERAEFIVGVGGGSVMDAAKASAWLATNSNADKERFMQGELRHAPLPLVLVGTTAGTGSEVSAVSVLTMDSDGCKRSLTHPNCYARISFADPRYTYTMPRDITVSTALDAFCHAVEGWFVPTCTDVITSFGEKALPILADGLEWLAQNDELPDETLREQLYYGSLWAGMVLNATGTAFPHPLGYILTEQYNVAHGMACAVFLPAFIERAERYEAERTQRMYQLCNGSQRVKQILDKLIEYDVSMTAQQVEQYQDRWKGLRNFDKTPGNFTVLDCVELFNKLFV